MRYIIDTDILIYFLKHVPQVVKKFDDTDTEQIATTIINYTELLFGAYNSSRIDQNLSRYKAFLEAIPILVFDKHCGETFASLKATLRKQGKTIADMDLMIASICMANDLILVTNNTKHFQRIKGLNIENWNLRDSR